MNTNKGQTPYLNNKRKSSYDSCNWFFVQKTKKMPKRKKCSSSIQPTFSQPTFNPGEVQLFNNTSVVFSNEERYLLSNSSLLAPCAIRGSRLDMAKNEHLKSSQNLLLQMNLELEKEKEKKESEKVVVIDDDCDLIDLFSGRSGSTPNFDTDYKELHKRNTQQFVTEIKEDKVKIKESATQYRRGLIEEFVEPMKEKNYNIKPHHSYERGYSSGERKFKRAFHDSCYSQEQESILPALGNLRNPMDMNLFSIKEMKKTHMF